MPSASRLTIRSSAPASRRGKNRRRPESLWSRLPHPHEVGCACGRVLRRSVPLIVVTCALLAVGGAVFAAHRFVTSSPRFAISSIEVRGTARMSANEILAALPVKVGDNVFAADLDELVAIARRHPWVASATAERILPDQIAIEVREHAPAAIAVLDQPYLVDAEGHPFKRAQLDAGDGADLPVVTGLDSATYRRDPHGTAKTIVTALATLAAWQTDTARPAIGEVHIDAARTSVTFRTYDGDTAIQLGHFDTELAARMQAFDAVWASLTDDERTRARALHLDARTDHVTVAFKN